MKTNPFSIFHIFSMECQYTIPMFQRRYVWSQERQWKPLWEDIEAKAIEPNNTGPHFLGAIVLNPQTPSLTMAVRSFDVIDGQQRLTTFQIFLSAFRDVAKAALPDDDLSKKIGHYVQNPINKKTAEAEKYKVWPTQADTEQFKDVVSSGSKEALEAKYPALYKRKRLLPRPAMVEAYLFFYEAILAFATTPGTDAEDRLDALYDALQNRLLLVAIELDSGDDPQVIFETLNARGAPLQPSDLLRNFVFLRATKNKEDAKELYEKYWSDFDLSPDKQHEAVSSFWHEEDRQGRLRRPKLDLFMQHFLALKTSNEVNLSRLFQEYRSWILSSASFANVEAELQELTKYAAIYRSLYAHNVETRLGTFTRRLRDLDTSTVYPLLLLLLGDKTLPAEELDGIVTDLESYLMRRMLCNRPTNYYNKFFLGLARDGFAGGATRAKLQTYLLSQNTDNRDWPDDATFLKAWLYSPIYRVLKPWRIEMVLLALEKQLHTTKQEKIQIQSKLTIEHVMPQSWEEHWPLPDGKLAKAGDDNEATVRRDNALQTFGNLTLLTQSLNSSVQNGPFAKKKAQITGNALLVLNAYFQTAERWNEEEIEKRGKALFEIAKTIWPHPGKAKANEAQP